jgi:hypothetical protein
MKTKILIAGFACLSVLAMAQSNQGSGQAASARDAKSRDLATGQASGKMVQQPAGSHATLNSSEQVTAPRDIATGQASGKRQYQPIIIRKATDDVSISAREAQSGQASGRVAPTNNGVEGRISSSQPAITENKKTMSPNEQTSASVSASQGAAVRESPTLPSKGKTQITAADLDGDGKADVAVHSGVQSPRESSTGMATGKRQHPPMPVTKEVSPSSTKK